MKKVLITGGSGFIGSYLINKLLLNGYKVNSIDVKNNLLIKNKNYKFFKGDIFNTKILNSATKNCDSIIHLAASLGVKNTDDNLSKLISPSGFG